MKIIHSDLMTVWFHTYTCSTRASWTEYISICDFFIYFF